MQAGENERYAGEDVAVSGFDDVRFPDELDFARQHRIRPLFVMPEDQQENISTTHRLARRAGGGLQGKRLPRAGRGAAAVRGGP